MQAEKGVPAPARVLTREKVRGFMSDKVKLVFFDKEMREHAERLELDKKTPEELLQEIQKDMDDPEKRKIIIETLSLMEKGDTQGLRKMWEELQEKKKEHGKHPLGVQNRKGIFICVSCIAQKRYDDPLTLQGFEGIYIFHLAELRPGLFFQCDDCKKKFSLEGIAY